jgi:hypothetical protein
MYDNYGIATRSAEEIGRRMAALQTEHDQEWCEKYSTTSYKLRAMAETAALAPSLPVFPLAVGIMMGGDSPKYAPLALSAVSALTVVPFIMKWPMKKASYGRRVAVGNGILALLGAAYGHQQARKKQKRVCGKVE